MAEFQINPTSFTPPAADVQPAVPVGQPGAVETQLPADRAVSSFEEQDNVQLRDDRAGRGTEEQQNNARQAEIDVAETLETQETPNFSLRLRYDNERDRVFVELINTESEEVISSRSPAPPSTAEEAGLEGLNALLEVA